MAAAAGGDALVKKRAFISASSTASGRLRRAAFLLAAPSCRRLGWASANVCGDLAPLLSIAATTPGGGGQAAARAAWRQRQAARGKAEALLGEEGVGVSFIWAWKGCDLAASTACLRYRYPVLFSTIPRKHVQLYRRGWRRRLAGDFRRQRGVKAVAGKLISHVRHLLSTALEGGVSPARRGGRWALTGGSIETISSVASGIAQAPQAYLDARREMNSISPTPLPRTPGWLQR